MAPTCSTPLTKPALLTAWPVVNNGSIARDPLNTYLEYQHPGGLGEPWSRGQQFGFYQTHLIGSKQIFRLAAVLILYGRQHKRR